ncbi:MAG: hypothetical protein ACLT2Z_07450 [Eubacterium sp.]
MAIGKNFSNVLNKVCNCKAGPELVEDMTKKKDGVFLAMLMGDKSKLEEDVKELYSLSGICCACNKRSVH